MKIMLQFKHNKKLETVNFLFDTYGNLFFQHNDNIYSSEIDGRNRWYLDKLDNFVFGDYQHKFEKLKIYDDGQRLKKKLLNEIKDEENEYDSDGEYIGDIYYFPQPY